MSLVYPNNSKIKDALALYFSRYHFPSGGYDLKWFKVKIGPVLISLPNTKGRIKAVKVHDIHHVITGYPATLKGEAEISGWEIALGCGNYYAAWFLDLGSFFYGMLFFPRALFSAFMKGRKCKMNLYDQVPYDDALLNQTVGEIRELVDIDSTQKNSTADYFLFVFYCVAILTIMFMFFYACYQAGTFFIHSIN